MPCKLKQGPRQYAGVVLNVSRSGLFVQTSASPAVGSEVEVVLANRDEAATLTAQVVWQRRVPGALRTVAEGGVGLRIQYAPEPYYGMLAEAAEIAALRDPG
jgi:Tfp pilus assembly protein PilZ